MTLSQLILYGIIGINVFIFILQQGNANLLYKLAMIPERVRKNNEYYRIISSAFGHTSILHIAFNMLALYSFAPAIMSALGPLRFLLIYLLSAIGSSFYIMLMRNNDRGYAAIGASGAISGIIYAFAYMIPSAELYLLFIPIPLPAWIFATIFTAMSLLLSQLPKAQGIISHEGHLGGGLTGYVFAMLYIPELLSIYPVYYPILAIGPILAFVVVKLVKPDWLYRYL